MVILLRIELTVPTLLDLKVTTDTEIEVFTFRIDKRSN